MLEKYFSIIDKNRKKFNKYLKKLDKHNSLIKKLEIAQDALDFAVFKNTGYFSCSKLEKFYFSIAETLETVQIKDFAKNTVLHVMSQASKTGGHTRIVEKWIEYADNQESHSVVIINQQKEENLTRLHTAIKQKNGQLISIKENDILKKASELRKLASGYEYIVLHIHMNDPISLIAFGTQKFERPIIFFNHADHVFWTGVGISDLTAELSANRTELSIDFRKVNKIITLSVPIDANSKITDKETARKKLGIDKYKHIIMTCGSSTKYTYLKEYNYTDIFKNFLQTRKDSAIIAIGPKTKEWKQIKKQYKDRLILLKSVDYEKDYFDYIAAADLLIDSFPMSGGTVMVDAINTKTPVLSLENPIGQFDYLVKSQAYCKDKKELEKKLYMILDNEDYKISILEELTQNLYKECSQEAFIEKVKELKKALPAKHKIYDFEESCADIKLYPLCVILNFIYEKEYFKHKKRKLLKSLKNILKKLFTKH